LNEQGINKINVHKILFKKIIVLHAQGIWLETIFLISNHPISSSTDQRVEWRSNCGM